MRLLWPEKRPSQPPTVPVLLALSRFPEVPSAKRPKVVCYSTVIVGGLSRLRDRAISWQWKWQIKPKTGAFGWLVAVKISLAICCRPIGSQVHRQRNNKQYSSSQWRTAWEQWIRLVCFSEIGLAWKMVSCRCQRQPEERPATFCGGHIIWRGSVTNKQSYKQLFSRRGGTS